MPLDLENSYSSIKEKIAALKSTKETVENYNKSIDQTAKSFEPASKDVTSSLQDFKKNNKRYQKNVKTQFDELFDIQKTLSDNAQNFSPTNLFNKGKNVSQLRKIMIEAANRSIAEIKNIITEEFITTIGCSQEQTYEPTVLFIPIKSIDLFELLKQDPNSTTGQILYEKDSINVQNNPFSMNRELFNRIQKDKQSYITEYGQPYLGASQQSLFDIEYDSTFGEQFKVTLQQRANAKNLVTEFLTDYFDTIQIFEPKDIYANLINTLTGAIDIDLQLGRGQIEDKSRFLIILQRILGLCFDDAREIDVSGVAKVAPLDGVDDSFFELTELDLLNLDQRVSNILRGVVTYEDCNVVNLPVQTEGINQYLLKFNEDTTNADDQGNDLTKTLQNLPGWPKIEELSIFIDTEIIKNLAKSLVMSILTPKVLLPLMILLKSLGQLFVDTIQDVKSFLNRFKKLIINIMSRVGSIFIKIVYEIIIRDLRQLLQTIGKQLLKNRTKKTREIIQSLLDIGFLIARGIQDYRKCKSVIDEIIAIITLALKGTPFTIPNPILQLAAFRSGFDDTRAATNVIEQLQKIGVPTGALPDGSPNLYLQSILSQITGVESERNQNGVSKTALGPIPVPPFGTLPSITLTGIVG